MSRRRRRLAPTSSASRFVFLWAGDADRTCERLSRRGRCRPAQRRLRVGRGHGAGRRDRDPAAPHGIRDAGRWPPVGQRLRRQPDLRLRSAPSGAAGAGADLRRSAAVQATRTATHACRTATCWRRSSGNWRAGITRPAGSSSSIPTGRMVRAARAAVPAIDPGVRPYSLAVLPTLDRVVTTASDMHLESRSAAVQIWRLSDLTLLQTILLAPGRRGDEQQLSGRTARARRRPHRPGQHLHVRPVSRRRPRRSDRARPVGLLVDVERSMGRQELLRRAGGRWPLLDPAERHRARPRESRRLGSRSAARGGAARARRHGRAPLGGRGARRRSADRHRLWRARIACADGADRPLDRSLAARRGASRRRARRGPASISAAMPGRTAPPARRFPTAPCSAGRNHQLAAALSRAAADPVIAGAGTRA